MMDRSRVVSRNIGRNRTGRSGNEQSNGVEVLPNDDDNDSIINTSLLRHQMLIDFELNDFTDTSPSASQQRTATMNQIGVATIHGNKNFYTENRLTWKTVYMKRTTSNSSVGLL